MEIVSPRWRARRRNPASRHAAREKGGVFTSPCSQTSGLSIGLTKISYVVYDILSSGADRAAIKPVQPRFQPLEGQHNAQAKLRGLRYLAGQPSACRVREWRLGQEVSPRPGFHPLPPQTVHEVFPHTAFRQPSSRSMRGPVSHVPTTTRHRFGPECAVDNPLATGHSLRGSFRDLWNWWNWPCRACTVTYLPTPARLKQGFFEAASPDSSPLPWPSL